MSEWKINNQSHRSVAIQQYGQELSVVEPLSNGSLKILSEIDLTLDEVKTYDESLFISLNHELLELNIFDNNK